jgi:hypothetical protein
MRIFLDMDGVLADFNGGYQARFGVRPDKLADDVDWEEVRRTEHFFRDLPPMRDLDILWYYFGPLRPTILTGVPPSVPEAADNKRAWVQKHLGEVPLIACRSRDKCLHAAPGDVLIDDWEKYRSLWTKAGGHWITHHSAIESIGRFELLMSKQTLAKEAGTV